MFQKPIDSAVSGCYNQSILRACSNGIEDDSPFAAGFLSSRSLSMMITGFTCYRLFLFKKLNQTIPFINDDNRLGLLSSIFFAKKRRSYLFYQRR